MKKILFCLLLLSSASAIAQTEVTEYKAGVTEEGITYFLPKTGLHFVLQATKRTYTPGEYAIFAERYLRLKDVAQTSYDEWTLDGATMETFGTADTTKAFSIKLKPKTSAPLVTLAEDGRLLAINSKAEATRQLTSSSMRKLTAPVESSDFKTEEILSAGSTAKMAELTANEIYDIRESRSALSKGQADFMPKDGEQLRLMLESLDKQEEALLRLFTGTTTTESHTLVFDVEPTEAIEGLTLFRFSKYLGLVDKDNLAGEPVRLVVRPQAIPAEITEEKVPSTDVRYTVPAKVYISLLFQQQKIAEATVPMAQFGRVETLGSELFNKKNTTHIVFSAETGGIVRIESDEK